MQKFRFSSVMVTAISLALFMAGAISGCAQGKSVGQEPGFVLSACDSVENWGYLPGDPAVLSQCTKIETDAGCIKVSFTKGADQWPAFKLSLGSADLSKYNTLSFRFKVSEPTKVARIVLCDADGTNANQGIPDIIGRREIEPNKWYTCEWKFQGSPGWVHSGNGTMDWSKVTGLWLQTDRGLIPDSKALVYYVDRIEAKTSVDKLAAEKAKFALVYKPGSTKGKKLLAFINAPVPAGGPDPAYLKENIEKIKYLPIDGLIFELQYAFRDTIFNKGEPVKYEDYKQAVEIGKTIDWGHFTDNFIRLDVVDGTAQPIDWFSDKEWAGVLSKVRVASRACKEMGLTGVMLDSEQYNPCHPFDYYGEYRKSGRSFAAYEAKVRERGKEYGRALTSYYPGIKVLLTFGVSHALTNIVKEEQPYSLMPAFIEGIMMAQGSPKVIDAFEDSYGYKNMGGFVDARYDIKYTSAGMVSNPAFYKKNIGVGFGSWISYGKPHVPDCKVEVEGNYFSPAEYESTLRNAMRVSDEYVWIYAEGWSVFTQPLPQGFVDAIRQSKEDK